MGPTDKALNGIRILVAEDEPLVAFDVLSLLLKAGAEVLGPALSVERSLELVSRVEWLSCGVLDVMLRDGPVFPVAHLLKQKGAGIVFYTGQRDPESLKREWPDAAVLIKPALPNFLTHAVIACLSRKLPHC